MKTTLFVHMAMTRIIRLAALLTCSAVWTAQDLSAAEQPKPVTYSGRGSDIKPWAEQWTRRPPDWFKYLEKHKMVAVFPQCGLGDLSKSIAGKKGDGWWQPTGPIRTSTSATGWWR